jgi:hypothetical protein
MIINDMADRNGWYGATIQTYIWNSVQTSAETATGLGFTAGVLSSSQTAGKYLDEITTYSFPILSMSSSFDTADSSYRQSR